MANQNASETTPASQSSRGQQPQGGAGQAHQNEQPISHSQRGGGLRQRSQTQPYFPSPIDFIANPFTAMRRMHEDMDRMFAQAFGGTGGGLMSGDSSQQSGAGLTGWSPAIEVKQKGNQLVVCAELPGLKPEEVQVEVNEDALVIQGERRHEQTQNEGGVHRTERNYGRFYRAIPLPEGVNADQAKAQFRDGMLEVSVPLPEQQSRRRQIPISGGESSTSRNQEQQASGGGS